jgi:hypothetical protein
MMKMCSERRLYDEKSGEVKIFNSVSQTIQDNLMEARNMKKRIRGGL